MKLVKAYSLGLLLAGSVFAGNVIAEEKAAEPAGKGLYTAKMCHTCHGEDGKKPIMPLYPKLAGQTKEYLVAQSKDIRDGKRTSGMSAAMKALVATVKDEEFDAIASWLADLK